MGSRQSANSFVSNRSDDPDNNFRDDLWIVKIVGSEIEQLTSTRGAEFHPRWSPDGSRIAYLAMSRELNSKDSPAENARLYILPSAGGQRRAMTGQDDHVINFEWHPDSNSLHFVTRAEGAHPLSRVKIETNTIDHILRGNFQVFEFDSDATGEFLVYSRTVNPNGDQFITYRGNFLLSKLMNFAQEGVIQRKMWVYPLYISDESQAFRMHKINKR